MIAGSSFEAMATSCAGRHDTFNRQPSRFLFLDRTTEESDAWESGYDTASSKDFVESFAKNGRKRHIDGEMKRERKVLVCEKLDIVSFVGLAFMSIPTQTQASAWHP
jgi:hypothetical protein